MKIAIQKNSLRLDTKNYTLKDIQKEVEEDIALLVHLGYTDVLSNTYYVAFGKQVGAFGTCHYNGPHSYEIRINQEYLKVGAPENVHNTIMHECIHSIEGCMNHGPKWKTAAAKVNAKFQFTPIKRTGNDEAYNQVVAKLYRYEATCNVCGRSWHWIRKGRTYNCCKAGTARCCCGSKSFTCKEL